MTEHEHYFYWYPTGRNEDGWRCLNAGCDRGTPHFSPELDRGLTSVKVNNILSDLHAQNFLYVSNASEGMALIEHIASQCKELDRYDQMTIIRLIYEAIAPEHAEYWAGAAKPKAIE